MIVRAALLLVCVAFPAFAQGLKTPYVPPYFPHAPGVVPMAAPQLPYYPGVNGLYGSVRFGNVRLGVGLGSAYAAPYAYPLSALNPYAFGYNPVIVSNVLPAPTPVPSIPLPIPNLAPNTPLNRNLADAEFTAKLDIVFPAPAEVSFDGRRVEGSDSSEVSLTSPPLKVGAAHTFNIRATWSVEGRKFQIDRAVVVKAGERSRLTIVSGDPVK